ncbi:hypothetical protein FOFC_02823 [Fusarium oxysporum]|nr:hypothetical protein FOFC_02823 [Fusarium oxysporum]
MALNFSADEVLAQIKNDGFYFIRDPAIGSKMDEMIRSHSRFSISDENGFKFWRDNIFTDPRIRGIMNSLESDMEAKYLLGHRGSLLQDPTHIKTFRFRGHQPDILIIQVWPTGSDAIFYRRSHTANLGKRINPTNMWEVFPKDLEDLGCDGERVHLEEGGIVIFDGRMTFDLVKGRCQYYRYFTSELAEREVKPLMPPPSQDINEVAKLGTVLADHPLHIFREQCGGTNNMSWKGSSQEELKGPLSSYWTYHLCDAKGQPQFVAAAATSSAVDHLRKYVNVSVTSRARASLTNAGPTGLLRAAKQLVQIRQPTDLNGPSDDGCSIALCHAPESRRFEN